MRTAVRDASGPPRWLEVVTFAALAALLYYPIHVPYQNPDQDYPALALLELVRGGWQPWSLHYPGALTNVLRAGYEVLLAGAWLVGRPLDAVELCAAYTRDPVPFRIAPRLIAMTCGVVSLFAAARLTTLVTDRWSGLIAAALLGTSYMFVREHHHGMFDAPAATAVMVSLYLCGRYIVRPATGTIAGAAAAAAIALSSKYNAAVVGCAPLLALWLAPVTRARRWSGLGVAVVAGVLALLVTSPVMVLEPVRVATYLARVFEYFNGVARVARAQGGPAYGFADVLRSGLGVPLVAATVLGALVAMRRRERALVPLLAFTLLYGWIVGRSPLVFNRYALPLAAPLAVLAAYGLHRALSFRVRVVAAAVLIAIGLPSCLAYDRLIAREDTRVAAARWLRAEVRPEAAVFMPGNVLTSLYIGPALPRPFVFSDMPPERAAALKASMAPRFPRTPRYFLAPARYAATPAGPGRLAPWSNAIVVTSETREGPFTDESTPLELIADLERFAVLVADYPVEAGAGGRTYEADLNYVPMRGVGTLSRPGPRMRIWYVPPSGEPAGPSPFLDGRRP